MGKHGRHGGRGGGRGGGRHGAKRGRMDGGRDGSGENADGQRNTWAAGSGSEKTSNKQLYKSEKFDEYYKAMNIMPESEWETFLEVMQSPLPVTFRINPLAPTAALVRQRLQSDPKWSQPFVMDDGRTVQPPRSLTWYPDAWQLGYGKPDLRKNSSLKAFHEWLIVLTAEGAISRQEAVSMIPPLLLDVQPHHEVLDMCAAPGSKTAQLLEALHAGELRGEVATGMVVANDSDSKRAYLLTHQCSRIGSPALMVTCHDAQIFPNLNKGAPRPVAAAGAAGADAAATAAAEKAARGNGQRTPGCFDRVLCDVPCSGDGTGRKNADVFTRWSPAAAIALHPLQIQIAMRGLALLKVGGLMAYSTCSLNPIEDEAVVAEILRRCGGAVELVDASKILPGLIYSPGKTEWTVMDKDMRTHASYEAALGPNENGHVSKAARKLYASCFAPAPEVVATYNLQHCMRVLPHQQDTGGFFICLFKKTAPLPSSMPWFDASAAKATAGASSGADAASSSSSGPASASGAAPAKATALDDADSEDEIDAAVTRPFYGRAGPGSSAEPFTGVALPPGSSQTHYVSAAGAGAAEPASSPSAEGDDEEAAAAAVVGQEAAADDDAEDNDGEDAEDDDADEEAAPSGAGAAAPTATVVATGANSRMVLPTGKQPVDRDSKGRALSGRFEMTVYTPVDPRSVVELHSVFGLTDAFPDHLLFTRSESSRAVTLVAEPVAKLVLPQQKTITGEGRVKTVNTGIKVFGENRGDKYKEKMDAKLLQQQSAASTGGDVQMSEPAEASSSSSSLSSAAVAGASATTTGTVERFGPGYAGLLNSDYRLMQDGIFFVLPYMTKQVVYVSGPELAQVLRYRGQFVSPNVYSKRLARALEPLAIGSFVLVLHPALDGHEDSAAIAPPASNISAALDIDEVAGTCTPRATVNVADEAAIPPALRSHYMPLSSSSSSTSSAAGSSDAAGSVLTFQPAPRVWTGSNLLSRAAACMWKGKAKYNLMVHGNEVASLLAVLKDAGYAAE